MSEQEIKYCIYPSVLNSFQRLLDAEIDAEDFSNIDSETGDYRRLPDEIAAEREQALIDQINHVPHAPIEIADRGTAFNEIIDCLIEHRKSNNNAIDVQTVTYNSELKVFMAMGDTHISGGDSYKAIQANINGFTFLYELPLCTETAKYFAGSIPQYLCQAELDTCYGKVLLYGYADYIFPNKVVDLKTCNRYEFGKYSTNWQKDLYPYCLIESGDMSECDCFEFYIVQMKGGTSRTPIISGTDYREEYTYNHEQATARLRQICERFIEWIEHNRELITNQKIFAND